MQYPICIEWGDDFTATGIQIPDIPGAVTAGDSFEEAYNAAVEIAHIRLQEIAAEGGVIPMPTSVADHYAHADYAGMGWGMLELDISPYLGKTEKVNVTLPGYVIQRIDRYVREHKVKSRSSFLADAALEKLVRS
ncbi:hypothetical protein FX985_01643 [Pseudomonas extremaustralis]|uniref:HicB-like antitoxin of toxin-antitoxin system domain-containing protein n=1 Tax=Pseudomonas extremaustralis TaxID=359110 RepID=A0A5M9IYC9_9PSED|nr:type II toxin-antitoxin system HicB family antitoxin [Pseudomonas extremaustralis]KAA8561591.1 hypothetical protein FX985_01643 [Pseudomonas extremaustralis]